jgi:hypothetical protein
VYPREGADDENHDLTSSLVQVLLEAVGLMPQERLQELVGQQPASPPSSKQHQEGQEHQQVLRQWACKDYPGHKGQGAQPQVFKKWQHKAAGDAIAEHFREPQCRMAISSPTQLNVAQKHRIVNDPTTSSCLQVKPSSHQDHDSNQETSDQTARHALAIEIGSAVAAPAFSSLPTALQQLAEQRCQHYQQQQQQLRPNLLEQVEQDLELLLAQQPSAHQLVFKLRQMHNLLGLPVTDQQL